MHGAQYTTTNSQCLVVVAGKLHRALKAGGGSIIVRI